MAQKEAAVVEVSSCHFVNSSPQEFQLIGSLCVSHLLVWFYKNLLLECSSYMAFNQWVLTCFAKWLLQLKTSPHVYGFSPVCHNWTMFDWWGIFKSLLTLLLFLASFLFLYFLALALPLSWWSLFGFDTTELWTDRMTTGSFSVAPRVSSGFKSRVWSSTVSLPVLCLSTSCSPSWVVRSSSCPSLICGGPGSSRFLSWLQSCCCSCSSSLQTCCCGSYGGKTD